MTDRFEIHGEWWKPESPDVRVAGDLSWSPQDAGVLRLHGQLAPDRTVDNILPDGTVQRVRRSAEVGELLPVVHGQTGNRCFTLVNCFRTAQRDSWTDRPTEDIGVNGVLEGAWFDDNSLAVDKVRFQIRDLRDWINCTGVTIDYPAFSEQPTDVYAVVTARQLPPIVVALNLGEMRFIQRLQANPEGISKVELTQDWILELMHPEEVPLQAFFDQASDVQDLISIATGRPAAFGAVEVSHPDLQELSLAGEPLGRKYAQYRGRWSVREEPHAPGRRGRSLLAAQMFFSFDDLGVAGLERWMSTAERFRTEIGRAMATAYSPTMFLEDRLMNLFAALDSLGKALSEGTYKQRLCESAGFAGDLFTTLIGGDTEEWAKRATDLRNEIAHHGKGIRSDVMIGDSLMSRQLYWLVILSLLRHAQAPASVFEAIGRHRIWVWLCRQGG